MHCDNCGIRVSIPLQAWTCTECGAPLDELAALCEEHELIAREQRGLAERKAAIQQDIKVLLREPQKREHRGYRVAWSVYKQRWFDHRRLRQDYATDPKFGTLFDNYEVEQEKDRFSVEMIPIKETA